MAINDRTTAKPGHNRYEELAEEIVRQIAANLLRPVKNVEHVCPPRSLHLLAAS
jgi:hypothetical protein